VASEQQVALVSGANRGLGREIARQLATDHGYLVLAGARKPRDAKRTAEELSSEGAEVVGVQLDVTDAKGVRRLAERIAADPGRLDVLVNNAGVAGDYDRAADFDLDSAKETLETNLFGAWRLTQAVLPLLRDSEHGRIVNMSSGMGQLSEMNGGGAAYRLSKVGLNALTRILSQEESGSRIIVNSVCPGSVRTDMGGRSARLPVEEGADTAVWLATLPDDGPSGGFFRNREPIPW
jgi:NAD(P)-dependent dehydrogenase (short-subunit alcohol dehydrogenase family)